MKNVLIQLFSILVALNLLTACGKFSSSDDAPKAQPAVFVLVENGGSISQDEQAHAIGTTLNLLQQLAHLRKRKATSSTQIYLLLSSKPNSIAWSGTAIQLLQQAKQVKDLLVFKPSFSDLEMSMLKIDTTIRLARIDNVKFYWVGSAINVPFQDTDGPLNVVVPQALPDDLALKNFADKLVTLKMYNVHPDQDAMVQLYLEKHDILRNGFVDFALKGKAQTKASLKKLL